MSATSATPGGGNALSSSCAAQAGRQYQKPPRFSEAKLRASPQRAQEPVAERSGMVPPGEGRSISATGAGESAGQKALAARRAAGKICGMQNAPGYTLRLAKQDFKFAAAHFTLFPDGRGELLHGHNYLVAVQVWGPQAGEMGLLIELADFKARIRAACARLDERTLIPGESALLRTRREGDSIEVRLGRRFYRLPAADVALLPLANVTIELLARLLWEQLAPALAGTAAQRLCVEVEETAGQSCAYAAPLSRGR